MSKVTPCHYSATGVRWDLTVLYSSPSDAAITQDLQEAHHQAQQFEQCYRDCLPTLSTRPSALYFALKELEELLVQIEKPRSYASLLHAAESGTPEHGSLLQTTQDRGTEIQQHLIFFELGLMGLPDATLQCLLSHPEVSHYRHYLERLYRFKSHRLSEPEERLLEIRRNTGAHAFTQLFDETLAAITVEVTWRGKLQELTFDEALGCLFDPQRPVRRAAARGMTASIQAHSQLIAYILTTLIQDYNDELHLRQFETPMSQRHLLNEVNNTAVDRLLTACERGYDTVQAYYSLKRDLLRVKRLYHYDRFAPIFPEFLQVDWHSCRDVVLATYADFSPELHELVKAAFDQQWIDAEPRQTKLSETFSACTVPQAHPYVLVSYTDRLKDMMFVAHELGHALHAYLSRSVGYLQWDTSLVLAEMVGILSELLVFDHLMTSCSDPRARLGLLCHQIDHVIMTVFWQATLTRFEQRLHDSCKAQGTLTTTEINALWIESNRLMYGNSLELSEDYAYWWAYLPHFIHEPFYCYAYAFGGLLALTLFVSYQQDRQCFARKYVELLSAGGSESAENLLSKLDIRLTDDQVWHRGIHLFQSWVAEAAALAASS